MKQKLHLVQVTAGIVFVVFVVSCARPVSAPMSAPADTATAEPTQPVPGTTAEPDERIRRVENGLVVMSQEGQPMWGQTRTIAERMAHYQVPGVGIAVINDYQVEWAKGYGVLEAGGDEPVTTDTLFHAGSIAKPVSAAAVLTLVERGLIDLDEDVNNKLISWQVPENEYTENEKVTLRRLLSHSAGLQDGLTDRSSSDAVPEYAAPGGEAPTVTLQALLNGEPTVDTDGPTRVAMVPGTEYRYANADYAIVELLVGDVAQMSFSEFMQETVLEPLQMASSTFEQPLPPNLRARATTEHDVNGEPFEVERLHFPFLAAGGLWTTPSDLARFATEIMLSRAGRSNIILSQEMVSEMLSPQIGVQGNPLGDASGLGFNLAGEAQSFSLMHTGGTWGSTSILWVHPETGQGAVVMTNSAAAQGMIRFEIVLSIAAEYGWPMR